jgi:molybdopterin/thiamine biosynthesis adenylyltransferase
VAVPPEQFARIVDDVNVPLLAAKLVVIVSVGTVGSQIARELANSGVGRLCLIDGDCLEESNLIRHALPRQYLGMNKAEAMTLYLAVEVPTLRAEALPRYADDSLSDDELDLLLVDADLVVASTGERDVQRRLGRRALALDIPAVFPALYEIDGGEVFVQGSPRHPCFFCWDGHRTMDEPLRGVTALNADTLGVTQLTVELILGVLDGDSKYAGLMDMPQDDPRPRQLFVRRRFSPLIIRAINRRPNCPSCAVGPAPSVSAAVELPGASPPQSPRQSSNLLEHHFPNLSVFAPLAGIIAIIVAVLIALSGGQANAPHISSGPGLSTEVTVSSPSLGFHSCSPGANGDQSRTKVKEVIEYLVQIHYQECRRAWQRWLRNNTTYTRYTGGSVIAWMQALDCNDEGARKEVTEFWFEHNSWVAGGSAVMDEGQACFVRGKLDRPVLFLDSALPVIVL